MTIYTMARLAAPILLGVATVAHAAGAQDDDLRVTANRTPAAVWRAAVARDINANLSAPRPTIGEPPEGLVKLMFRADPSGRINQVSVVRPSGSPALDRAAVIALSRMRTLPTAPAGIDATRPVEAWIYFANTDAAADHYEAVLRRPADHLAQGSRPAPLVVTARG